MAGTHIVADIPGFPFARSVAYFEMDPARRIAYFEMDPAGVAEVPPVAEFLIFD